MLSDEDLGPLPNASTTAALQRESVAALGSAIEHSQLVIRDERYEDYGVDASLEVVASGKATNFRAQVQIKARSVAPNVDGSFSVDIDVSNLNYLLNGPCPIYVFYQPETRALRYFFARDELRRLEKTLASWPSQKTITFRLSKPLDPPALRQIHSRILSESKLHRKLRDKVVAVAPEAAVHLRIDPSAMTVETSGDAATALATHGMALISRGFATRVLELGRLLGPQELRGSPKLHLVQGYAAFFNRQYLVADPHLRHALLEKERLEPDERQFLDFLVSAAELALGRIDKGAFRSRSKAWRSNAPLHLAIQYDILHFWTLQAEAKSPEQLEAIVGDLRGALERAEAEATVPETVRRHARLLKLYLDMLDLAESIAQAVLFGADPELSRHVFEASPHTVVGREFARADQWRQDFSRLLKEIQDAGDVAALCEAHHARGLAESFLLLQLRNASALVGYPPPKIPEELVENARRTRELAQRVDQVEIELRTLLHESDLEDIRGNLPRADELSELAREKASILRYAEIERVAERQLKGGDRFSKRLSEIAELREGNLATFFAAQTDEELDRFVEYGRSQLKLPRDRLPVLREVALAQRASAQEHLQWCRHLQLMEVGADNRPGHVYRELPARGCRCEKLGYRSSETSQDWRKVIGDFKEANCKRCDSRSPLQAQPA